MLNPHVFQEIKETIGPLEVDLFASHLTRQLPLLQLESWPRSYADRCIHAGPVSSTTVCQSTVVLDSPLFLRGDNAFSIASVKEDPILVSNPAGIPERLFSDPTDFARSGDDASTTGFLINKHFKVVHYSKQELWGFGYVLVATAALQITFLKSACKEHCIVQHRQLHGDANTLS